MTKTELSTRERTRRRDEVADVASAAAARIRERYLGVLGIQQKHGGDSLDIVTEVDHEVEGLICAAISESSPGASIIAEERGLQQAADIDSVNHHEGAAALDELGRKGVATFEDLWIVDPLDGTVNYAQGLPLCAVSIARYSHGEHVASAIYLPILGEEFLVGDIAAGATCNGDEIRVSDRMRHEECVVAVGSTHHPIVREVTRPCLGWRRIGSAAVSFAYVACGRFDAYLQLGQLAPWDYAAGVPLVQAAGGMVSESIDRTWNSPLWRAASVVAATPFMREQISSIPH